MILHRAIRVIRKPSKMRKLRNGLGRSFHFIWVSSAGANLFFLSFSSLFSRKSKEINIFVRRLNFCRPVHQSDKTSMNIVEPAQMGQKRHRRKKRQTESECILSIPYSIVYIANLYRSKVSFFSFPRRLTQPWCVSLYTFRIVAHNGNDFQDIFGLCRPASWLVCPLQHQTKSW